MSTSPGPDDLGSARIAGEIETLYQAVLDFRGFLYQLPSCQRDALLEGLPWSDGGSEIWIDLQAWVRATRCELGRPACPSEMCPGEHKQAP